MANGTYDNYTVSQFWNKIDSRKLDKGEFEDFKRQKIDANNVTLSTEEGLPIYGSSLNDKIIEMYKLVTQVEEVVLWDKNPNSKSERAECFISNVGDEIVLADDVSNYEYIDFFAITDDNYRLSLRIDHPTWYDGLVNFQQVIAGQSSFFMKCRTFKIVGGNRIQQHYYTVSGVDCTAGGFVMASANAGDNSRLNLSTVQTERQKTGFGIYKVIGYRKKSVSRSIYNMTLEEKVGQMFIVRPEMLCDNLNSNQQHGGYGLTGVEANLLVGILKYKVGGILISQKNIDSYSQLKQFISDFKNACDIKPFISVDEEGGKVSRVMTTLLCDYNSTTKLYELKSNHADIEAQFTNPPVYYPSVMTAADAGDSYTLGDNIGRYLAELGFNLDFAPCADVWTNPENTVIGERAFGTDPNVVAQRVGEFIEGIHNSEMLCSIKHYPGHGDTVVDSHYGLPEVTKTWGALKQCELVPFAANLDTADFVMVAHILESGCGDTVPASLSYKMVTEKLRRELGYKGVIITDGFEMKGITDHYTPAEACVAAVKAGCDMMISPMDLGAAIQGICDAVRNGEIPEERINQSVEAILNLKKRIYR